MLFNSFTFVAFFVVVYGAYLALRRHLRWQNTMLLLASYVFYGAWDWRFLLLLQLSTVIDYGIGRALGNAESEIARNRLLWLSLVVNLGILGFFKYFNFFQENAVALLRLAGLEISPYALNVVLPVGVSFYTFQSLSYTIDIYWRRMQPARSLADYALFVAFFPQLVAGPIERAAVLLPQVERPRTITAAQAHAGLGLILWGYFKKVVVADNVSVIADQVFNDYTQQAGLDLLIGALAFTLQIYGDFSGYTDIARGIAKLMGFELMLNFRLPYFASSPSDFWERWHISLSSWLREYVYIPLGGNRSGASGTYRNLMLTMLIGGLWHGAAWNFVLWGGYHGLALVLYRVFDRRGDVPNAPIRHAARVLLMFCITVGGWILFRCQSMEQILHFATHMGVGTSAHTTALLSTVLWCAAPVLAVELVMHVRRDLLVLVHSPLPLRVSLYAMLLLAIAFYGSRAASEFIYFQF